MTKRQRKGRILYLVIRDDEVMEWIRSQAKARHLSLSQFVRACVRTTMRETHWKL